MSSARGSNKAQAVGTARTRGGSRKQNGRSKEIRNLERQFSERTDLLARFRARVSPAIETTEKETS